MLKILKVKGTMKRILLFTSKTCNPCKQLKPILKALAEEFKYPVEEIDIEIHKDIAFAYKIMSVPTIIIEDGKKSRTKVGASSEPVLRKFIQGE